MRAQRLQLKSMFGQENVGRPAAHEPVLQGYFVVSGQNTNDESQFADGASQADKEAQVWLALRPAVEAAWKARVGGHHYNAAVLDDMKDTLLKGAFAYKRKTLTAVVAALEGQAVARAQAAAEVVAGAEPLEDRASPAGVGGAVGTAPTLAGPNKHSAATYRRRDAVTGVVTNEVFTSDNYTKGPARRARVGVVVLLPVGLLLAWTKKQIRASIRNWSCDASLARHLAVTVWPLLPNTVEGRTWELKFREMDRLVTFRQDEAQSRTFTIWKKRPLPKTRVKSLNRDDFNVAARQLLKAAILGGQRHPAEQQGVRFYDRLLKGEVDKDMQDPRSVLFDVNAEYEVPEDLSMTLTHWRAILLFDWILAEDVLNNAR